MSIHAYDDTAYAAKAPFEVEALTTAALPVDLERISLPSLGATCRPELHLLEPRRTQFCNVLRETNPVNEPLPPLTRPCHRIDPADEKLLIRKLLDRKMCVLLPEAAIPKDTTGNVLRGGLFCVKHKAESDRLINDRRVLNSLEEHLQWARLPLGTQLCRLFLRPGQVCVASGDDLSNFSIA
jgi:hypothetical protein